MNFLFCNKLHKENFKISKNFKIPYVFVKKNKLLQYKNGKILYLKNIPKTPKLPKNFKP